MLAAQLPADLVKEPALAHRRPCDDRCQALEARPADKMVDVSGTAEQLVPAILERLSYGVDPYGVDGNQRSSQIRRATGCGASYQAGFATKPTA